jgi:hypothetical protein
VRGFLRALLRGLQDALNDPELAFNTSKKFVEGLGSSPQQDEIQRKVLAETPAVAGARAGPHRSGPMIRRQVLIDMGPLKDKIPTSSCSPINLDEGNRKPVRWDIRFAELQRPHVPPDRSGAQL